MRAARARAEAVLPRTLLQGPGAALLGPLAAYVGALALAPFLPAAALGGAALVCGAGILVARRRREPAGEVALAAALWAPLHLLILATGGPASPLWLLAVPWTVLVLRRVRPLAATGLLGGALALSTLAGARPAEVAGLVLPTAAAVLPALAALATGVACAAAAGLLAARRPGGHVRLRGRGGRAATHGAGGWSSRETSLPPVTGVPLVALEDPTDPAEDLLAALAEARARLGLTRLVLWEVEGDGEYARPLLVSGGEPPGRVTLRGDPLRWAWEEGIPLRLDRAPTWARPGDRVAVQPVEPPGVRGGPLLTAEWPAQDAAPPEDALAGLALLVRAVVRLSAESARATASAERLDQLLRVLRRLPEHLDAEDFATQLAAAAAALAGGTGAALAFWNEDEGQILALYGEDGGAEPGCTIGAYESELALAARGGATLVRERGTRARRVPILAEAERWSVPPRALAAVPLPDPAGRVIGVLAVWSTDADALDPAAVGILETLAPYAGLQLLHAAAFLELRHQAETDALTGLPNRRAVAGRLAHEALRVTRYGRPLAALILDIDHFKQVNDTLGHDAGDHVLRQVARAVAGALRDVDVAGRWGGEEFVVLLPETRLAEAVEVGERLRHRVRELVLEWQGHAIPVAISVGVAASPAPLRDPALLVARADAALYAAKAAGRDRVVADGAYVKAKG
jgi:diguanylate cyclase (GGDEF)-like protein